MKAMRAKTRAKKPNGKVKFPSAEPVPDLSHLRPPIDTSVSNLYRVAKVLETGTEEVKAILSYECDLMYECRVCRSIFRSMMNLISHKRVYCKEKFDTTHQKFYDTICTSESDVQSTERVLDESGGNDRILRSQTNKPKDKKDLTMIVNMLQIRREVTLDLDDEQSSLDGARSGPTANGVVEPKSSARESTEVEVGERAREYAKVRRFVEAPIFDVQRLESRDTGRRVVELDSEVVQCDRQLNNNNMTKVNGGDGPNKTDSVRDTEHICPLCYEKFSSKKTLTVHTKTVHTSQRLCYPCPYCPVVFANTWSAHRHLYKVHKQSNEQVRKLRSQIQQAAFVKDTGSAVNVQKESVGRTPTNSANVDRITEMQEWMDHLESDTELQRCGGCGKRFDRRVALLSHMQHCQMRIVAFEGSVKGKKTNKASSESVRNGKSTSTDDGKVQSLVDARTSPPSSVDVGDDGRYPRAETIAGSSKDEWEKLNDGGTAPRGRPNGDVSSSLANRTETEENVASPTNDNADSLEIVYVNIDKRKNNVGSKKRRNKITPMRVVGDAYRANDERIAGTEQLDYTRTMERKLLSIVNLEKLECLPCKQRFSTVNSVKKHAANHVGWNRFGCKLCDYKCFAKYDCAAHCNKVHNAQNKRDVVEDMIARITDDRPAPSRASGTNSDEETKDVDAPEVVEVSVPADRAEPEVQVLEESTETESTETESTETGSTETGSTACDAKSSGEESVRANVCETEESLDNGMRMGLDPEVKKMVLEVIFGPSEVDSMERERAQKAREIKEEEDDDEEAAAAAAEPKEKIPRENDSVPRDGSKPQRPIRRRMKPLNKDFIYDLKDLTSRKFPVVLKPLNKSLGRKCPAQEEDGAEKEFEQPAKRFKSSGHNGELPIICENDVADRSVTPENDSKDNRTSPQCHS